MLFCEIIKRSTSRLKSSVKNWARITVDWLTVNGCAFCMQVEVDAWSPNQTIDWQSFTFFLLSYMRGIPRKALSHPKNSVVNRVWAFPQQHSQCGEKLFSCTSFGKISSTLQMTESGFAHNEEFNTAFTLHFHLFSAPSFCVLVSIRRWSVSEISTVWWRQSAISTNSRGDSLLTRRQLPAFSVQMEESSWGYFSFT